MTLYTKYVKSFQETKELLDKQNLKLVKYFNEFISNIMKRSRSQNCSMDTVYQHIPYLINTFQMCLNSSRKYSIFYLLIICSYESRLKAIFYSF